MKSCKKCGELDPEKFYQGRRVCKRCICRHNSDNRARINEGRKRYYHANKEVEKVKGNKAAQKRRQKIRALTDEQKRRECLDCKTIFHPVAMDYDHRDGEIKLFEISQARSLRRDLYLAEIAKCDLVCANCHRHRTYLRRIAKRSASLSKTMKSYRKIEEYINQRKNKPCEVCLGQFHPWQMDFDHLDRVAKLSTVSELHQKRAAIQRIEEEMAKCRLLCANCHRIETERQRQSMGRIFFAKKSTS